MKLILKKIFQILFFILNTILANSQTAVLSGKISSDGKPIEFANVGLLGTSIGSSTDRHGNFKIINIPPGSYKIQVSYIGFNKMEKSINIKSAEDASINFDLTNYKSTLNEVVITGTLKEMSKLESPVPVEVYTPSFFKKNPTPSIYECLQNVNGVRPQLNCQVCNTGDIHINGLEGPYTMVLIDGMPIVSSLSTVYGLSGIPNSLVERIEVVKGPASSLYGSEAVGGLINIITKSPKNAPLFSADFLSTSWKEFNTDLAFKLKVKNRATVLAGINYFNFQNKIDNNKDNFTDMTLQNRISVFQKWNLNRKENRLLSIANRIMVEDRWGGDLKWNKNFRGGDSIYGESIYTKRWEILGNYQLPTTEKLMLSFSFNRHNQNSRYGTIIYNAQQNISFSQLTWDRKIGINDFLIGCSMRYTFYDDNTPATSSSEKFSQHNQPQKTWLPGIFIQNEITLTEKHKLLTGFRIDYNHIHGAIYTPRLAYKYSINNNNIIRLNAGTGFRVVNLFTEDHAALTGARIVEIKNQLNPERSYNVNINYIKKLYSINGNYIGFDASVFYTYFNNRIIGNYDQDPNKIIYNNLSGYAESKGITLNLDVAFNSGLKIIAGSTLMENTITANGKIEQQILTEKLTGTWALSYKIKKIDLSFDYTGNFYSPMRLPLLSETDPRQANSPWWSIQNIQIIYDGFKNIEIYCGLKNLLNWTPNKNNPFIIARTIDPFDKLVKFDSNGKAIITSSNPYGLTFDPGYVYAPNQGIRIFLGCRINLM